MGGFRLLIFPVKGIINILSLFFLPAFASGSKILRPGERDLPGAKYYSCMASKIETLEHIYRMQNLGQVMKGQNSLLVQQAAIYAIRTQPTKY